MTDLKVLDEMLEYYVKLDKNEKKVYLDVLLNENEILCVDFCDYCIMYDCVEDE